MNKTLSLVTISLTAVLIAISGSEASWPRRFCRHACPPPVCPLPLCPIYASSADCVCTPTLSTTPQVQIAPIQVAEFVSSKGRKYRIIDTGEKGEFFETERAPTTVTGATQPDDFDGNDRKTAKTSIADAPIETFASVKKFLGTLESDSDMLNLGISKDATSNRVTQEKRNVSVSGFIYAFKFETDNDFHVILGMDPDSGIEAYVNVEISGLPQGGPNRAPLKTVRTAFKDFFTAQHTGFSSTYKKFDPPIPVRIQGSLFFDVDHKAGVVGPTGMRPTTAWEIHPVTKIEFEIDP
jgi:hypothetical protein